MPKNLTDVSTFATIAVPVGTDPALASSVETPFQLLANRTRYLINLVKAYIAACYLNYTKADTTGISTFDLSNVMAGCIVIDENDDAGHTIIDNDGNTAICEHAGYATPAAWGGGVEWDDEISTPASALSWTSPGTKVDICGSWDSGSIFERCAVSNYATGKVGYSTGAGSWFAATGVSGTTWTACEYGYPYSELWVIGGNSGAISTSPNISTTAFTSRTSGLSGNIVRIRSNRKPDGDHRFLALDDNGDIAISSYDGSAWTASTAASLGLTSTLESIAWDALNDRWTGIQYNGYLAWSEDNGATWTENAITPSNFNSSATNVFLLDCDDQGNLILNIHYPSNKSQIWIGPNGGDGFDNGMIWQEAYHQDMYTYSKVAFMGHSRVISVGSGGILYSDANFNTRWSA